MSESVSDLQTRVRALWNKACKHDGIDPKAKFVAFSDGNPVVPEYDKAMKTLQFVRRCQRVA